MENFQLLQLISCISVISHFEPHGSDIPKAPKSNSRLTLKKWFYQAVSSLRPNTVHMNTSDTIDLFLFDTDEGTGI